MEKRNSHSEHGQPMEQTRGLFCTCDSCVACCQSANEFDVRSVLQGQVSLETINQICVIHEATYRCKNLKIH